MLLYVGSGFPLVRSAVLSSRFCLSSDVQLQGASMILDSVSHALRDDNLKFWHKNFMTWGNPNNPYTCEANAGGERIVFTADPENIKAILATQFNDFGKGEQFNKDWHEFLGDGKTCSSVTRS